MGCVDGCCYVSDLEEGEKTLLLHEREGKLSRVRSRLIYRFSRGSSVHRAGLHSGAEADRSGTVTEGLYDKTQNVLPIYREKSSTFPMIDLCISK